MVQELQPHNDAHVVTNNAHLFYHKIDGMADGIGGYPAYFRDPIRQIIIITTVYRLAGGYHWVDQRRLAPWRRDAARLLLSLFFVRWSRTILGKDIIRQVLSVKKKE